MKKIIWGCILGFVMLLPTCGSKIDQIQEENKTDIRNQDEITIMHEDAETPEFQKFISYAEKKLDMKIHLIPCPDNADNRQAKISTILSAGESSVDIFTVNDEMVSEFKYKGYLEPLNDSVMTEDLISCYPESYMENVAMLDGSVYSVPYFMDIMVFWVNKSMVPDLEIRTQEDFEELLSRDFGENRYGYGSAWDSSYVYNELMEFIHLFGGDYCNWEDPGTRKALDFLYEMVQREEVPVAQVTDQYEQMEQKFLEGTYASIMMYSGAMDTFVRAGAYREDYIQVVPLPEFEQNATNIGTWQYVLNHSSGNKDAAERFLRFAAGKEGSITYAEYMNRLPARLDIIREENLDIPGFEELRDYVLHTELKERHFTENTMEDIVAVGNLFQKYVLGEISQDDLCLQAQDIIADK